MRLAAPKLVWLLSSRPVIGNLSSVSVWLAMQVLDTYIWRQLLHRLPKYRFLCPLDLFGLISLASELFWPDAGRLRRGFGSGQ